MDRGNVQEEQMPQSQTDDLPENGEFSNNKQSNVTYFPSAELLQVTCFEEYKRILDMYYKIYDKVNVSLVFCGTLFLIFFSNYDFSILAAAIKGCINKDIKDLSLWYICDSILSAGCFFLLVWSVIQLILLLKSKPLDVLDIIEIRNRIVYIKPVDIASAWLIGMYTDAVNKLLPLVNKKQKRYDCAIIKIIICLLLYAVELVIQKGMIGNG